MHQDMHHMKELFSMKIQMIEVFGVYDVNTGRNQTQFSYVNDENENFGFDLTFPLELR